VPPLRSRSAILVGVLVVLLALGALLVRTFRTAAPPEARGRGTSGTALVRPIPMPSLEEVTVWRGAHGPLAPGTPMALVIFSTTDPRAPSLLAEAEAWHDAYGAKGVRVIGLHRPEFAFAADSTLLGRYLDALGISFPVAHDPGLAVRFGATLRTTTALVGEASGNAIAVNERSDRSEADLWLRGRSQGRALPLPRPPASPALEGRRLLRLGAGQVATGPLADVTAGVPATFVTQTRGEEEGRAWVPIPVGRWTPRGEGLEARRGGAANFLAIRYHAARVGVVVSPPPGLRARLWILRDEAWVAGSARGRDLRTDAQGATYVDVDEPRLLIPVENDTGWHVLKLSPDVPGVVLHALTFDMP
jgi:hypothetical protein